LVIPQKERIDGGCTQKNTTTFNMQYLYFIIQVKSGNI